MPIYKNETADVITESFGVCSFRFEPGDQISTPYVLINENLTEVNAAPYFNPLQVATETVTSTGPGDDQTITINLDTDVISILNQGDSIVTVFLRSLSNIPGLNCYSWTERIIAVNHNVDEIVLQFAAAGTVYVEQRS